MEGAMPPMADVFGRRGFGLEIAYGLALLVCGIAAACVFAATAAAATEPSGGSAPSGSAGGAASTPVPRVFTLACVKECGGVRAAKPAAVVRLRGRNLDYAESVVFLGIDGSQDDVVAEPAKVRKKYVVVHVPRRAQTGPVAVVTADGIRSAPSRTTLDVVREGAKRAGADIDVEISAHKVFFDAERQVSATFMVRESSSVAVELLRAQDGAVVYRWDVGQLPAGAPKTVTWDGTAGGKVQADGRYDFRVVATSPDGAVKASTSQAGEDDASVEPASFVFLRHKFPVRGRHDYGEFAASFGGGRGHEGHDVFAKCGTPLVAARGGIVKLKQSHSRAGNYVVIDGEATDEDYVYMHLRDKALVDKGDRVHTGQLIGYVGDTGRAHGCHLHFEMWSGPGWYSGGSPFDPLPNLKAWDRQS
jgi:murein DD-endopeptidase MepM/ murein hydrolase activator NlpD